MQQASFLSSVSEFQNRANQVRLAVKLSRSNHVVQCTIRAIFNAITDDGLSIRGKVDKRDIVTKYLPFVQSAVASLITVGYFAFLVDKTTHDIIVFEPDAYVVVPSECDHNLSIATDEPFIVIFLKQDDCDKYRKTPPKLVILNPPTETGLLQCPVMSVVDMHDAIIEFTRMAIINDAINLRPKAWISKKDTAHAPGVYHYLDPKDLDSSEAATGDKLQKNREQAARYVAEQNMRRGHDTWSSTNSSFADTCISRKVVIDAVHDPSVLVEVLPNMDITAMAQTRTRTDLVDMIQLFDRRMCNALGIPTLLLGIPAPGMAHVEEEGAMTIWKQQCKNYMNIMNHSFAILVEHYITPRHAQEYKKSRDRSLLYPVKLSLNMSLTKNELISLAPFLKPAAMAKHMAAATGLEASDFVTIPEEPKK